MLLFSVSNDGRAQQVGAVSGTVVDVRTGAGVPQAQVLVAGTLLGTLTDESGAYHLSGVPARENVVRVEMAGYAVQEKSLTVTADRTTTVDFRLVPQVFQLDEVVVTGTAGSARHREVAHSIDYILPDEIPEPVPTLDQLLAGRVPGVTVLASTGLIGSGSQIRLRGNTSLSLSNQPLVYVDGVRIRSDGYPKNVPPSGDERRGPNDVPSPINDISPIDIERVEIVKGPAATTLYGGEAATGVIQIFTKRGMAGRREWRAQVDQSVDEVQQFGPDAAPFLGLDPWLRSAWRQRYAGSTGGGGAVRYFVSGLYDRNEGVLPNDGQDRVTLRGNFDVTPIDGLDLAWSSSYTKNDLELTPGGGNSQGLLSNVYRGPVNFLGDSSHAALARILEWDISTDIDHLITGLTANWSPSPTFSNRLALGYDRAQADMRQLRPFGFVFAPGGILSEERWVSGIFTFDYVGSLERQVRPDLRATLSWGGQSIFSEVTSDAGYAESFPGPEEQTLDSGALRLDFETRSQVTNGGVFGQALFGYRDRWFLTAGSRLDGNSALGEALGLQLYPRVGLSYVVSDEDWWPERLGRLKLRAAYGHAGRAPGAFDETLTWRNAGFDGDSAFVPDKIGNPDLGPERTAETELGFEGAFLHDRVAVDFTAYHRKTTDALFPVRQIPSLGFLGTQLENVGSLRNTGIELALTGVLVRTASLGWDAGLNLATNHSKVLDLGGAPSLNLGRGGWLIEGEPVPVMRGRFITNEDELAEPEEEVNHIYGPNLPTLTVGLTSALRLPSGVLLSARGEYLGGHFVSEGTTETLAGLGILPHCAEAYPLIEQGLREQLTAWERSWCDPDAPRDDDTIYPADFFRLREVTLQAPLPFSVTRGGSTTLTLTAHNWLTWKRDEFRLFVPDQAGSIHSTVRGIEPSVPVPATFTLSLRAVH